MATEQQTEQGSLLNTDCAPESACKSSGLSTRHRSGYTRVASVSFHDSLDIKGITDRTAEDNRAPAPNSRAGRAQGLGINSYGLLQTHPTTITLPLQASSHGSARNTPEQLSSIYSPPSTGVFTGSTEFDEQFDLCYQPIHKDSRISLRSGTPSTYAKSEAGLLSVRSRYDEFQAGNHCASTRNIKTGRFKNCISVTVLALALFSTAFSITFAVIASTAPTWGKAVRNSGGRLTPSTAAFVTSLFAKLIELSFVTVIVAFIGQALARRAHRLEHARGITLAELSMRTWIMQPGTMLTNWESVRYAGITVLAIISLLGAIVAVLYTSAATALVQPQLRWPHWEEGTMQGLVLTQPFNPIYSMEQCRTPIRELQDPDSDKDGHVRQNSCMQVTHAALAYRNFQAWLSGWTDVARNGSGSANISWRPKGYALHQDNTTMIAPWIHQQNITTTDDGIIYNNVTMAMPHVGIIQAANDPLNDLIKVEDFEGASLNIKASVPSPIVNVLCATMSETDLKPFVWALWDGPVNKTTNYTAWPYMFNQSDIYDMYLNGTRYDDIFGWGEKYGYLKVPPVFPKLPLEYNTLLNDTTGLARWGRTTIYILGKGGRDTQGNPSSTENYALCQMQAGITEVCSTHYNATGSGATMEAICEDEGDSLQYGLNTSEELQVGNASLNKDWPNLASEWARSCSLSAGINDGQASIARILTNFIATTGTFSTSQPSMAEALAVMAGHTLIQSMTNAPFVGKAWNYTLATLDPGRYETFKSSRRVQQYTSGGNAPYQKSFFLVLYIVAIMNILILLYFLVHNDWYTDLSEPVNLFSLAVNSPPSEKLAGSCGCGPSGEQYKVSWKLSRDGEHYFVESQEPRSTGIEVRTPRSRRRTWTQSFEMMQSPVSTMKDRFSRVL